MGPEHINKSRSTIRHAKRRLEEFIAARGVSDVETGLMAWVDFVAACGRIYDVLARGAIQGPAKDWFAGVRKQRDEDELLLYFWKARNTEVHSPQLSTGLRTGQPWIGATFGGLFVGMAGTPGGPKLVTVSDREGDYPPPMNHLGAPIGRTPGVGMSHRASLLLAYTEKMVDEAAGFLPDSNEAL